MNATEQQTRRERLQALTDDFHRSRYGDYDDTYREFAAVYGLKWDGGEVPESEWGQESEEIPRYASLHSDETYGMISTFEDLAGAVRNQIPTGEDTLSVPSGVIDLDTGKTIEVAMFAIPSELRETLLECIDRGIEYHDLAIVPGGELSPQHAEDNQMQLDIIARFNEVRNFIA